jgi:hypothetical protein
LSRSVRRLTAGLAFVAVLTFVGLWGGFFLCLYLDLSTEEWDALLKAVVLVPWAVSGVAWVTAHRSGAHNPDRAGRWFPDRMGRAVFVAHSATLLTFLILITVFHDPFVLTWLPAFYRALGVLPDQPP